MTPVEKDDFIHALTTTMRFYGKTLDQGQVKVWFKALSKYPIAHVGRALDEYPQVGKFAPKPVDILEILTEYREREAANQSRKDKPYTPCPPDIAAAWRWFLGQTMDDSDNFKGIFSRTDIPAAQQEKYLHVVNHAAKEADLPDAIPDEYKLQEVWG